MSGSEIILSVENVSKLYRLGTVGTGTFGGDVQRFWKTKILGQEDPFLKVGQINDRTSKEKADFVWALKDINFEINRGEVLGIIGKNGAGKSTLLKLLSRITSPTTGSIKSAGRMASLLEVGTGFHPELTGRENIYLNGAILGMTKKEIQRKFDEIVDFSGCELYIDTPTKRYSSGMTVRLGFAVAAFLDPEILVVDEVLAVGDDEFQRKAIGKMKEVNEENGKTVLIVSHNMDSIARLCNRSILLENGHLTLIDETANVISTYLKKKNYSVFTEEIVYKVGNLLTIEEIKINANKLKTINIVHQGEDINFQIRTSKITLSPLDFIFNFELSNSEGVPVTSFGNEFQNLEISLNKENQIVIELGPCLLKKGIYYLNVYFKAGKHLDSPWIYKTEIVQISVEGPLKNVINWKSFIHANQHGHLPIEIKALEVKSCF